MIWTAALSLMVQTVLGATGEGTGVGSGVAAVTGVATPVAPGDGAANAGALTEPTSTTAAAMAAIRTDCIGLVLQRQTRKQ